MYKVHANNKVDGKSSQNKPKLGEIEIEKHANRIDMNK